MLLSVLALSTLTSVLPAGTGPGNDWPQFRGPVRDGNAPDQPLAARWPEGGPVELWRRPLGTGFSTITSVGDRLYTMSATETQEEALCLDADTGATLWRVPLGVRYADKFGDGPRSTPTVDGDLVFVVSSTLQLAALETRDGGERWRSDLLERYGIEPPRYGFASSTLVVEDRVLLAVGGGEGRAVVAFDRGSGEVLWSALDGPTGKSSPVLADLGGVRQVVFSLPGRLASLSLDGEVLWTHPIAPDVMVMAQLLAPDRLFTSSAQMGQGGVTLRVTADQGSFAVEPVWVNRRFRNHFNNPVVVDGHLYGFDNSTLRCVDADTGELRWSERGLGKGSLIACGHQLFALGDQGTLVLIAATPESYQERGRVQALEGRCWTSPSLAGGRLLVRNLEEAVAYDVGPAPTGITLADPDQPTGAVATEAPPAPPDLDGILAAYERARGGRDRWREVQALELQGTFRAFSESSPFTLRRHREDRYRFDYGMAGGRDARGRDAEGLWWKFNLFQIQEPSREVLEAYHAQLRRESWFEPALIGAEEKGIRVEWIGVGEVNGRPTLDLRLTFPDETVETWMLDPRTFLEVAVDARVVDMTQAREPMDRRTFFSDFREVDGLRLPFLVAMEFGARLEEMHVTRALVDPGFRAEDLSMPGAAGDGGGSDDGAPGRQGGEGRPLP